MIKAVRIFIDKILDFCTAFFGCWAIQLSTGITVRNPLTVVLFVAIYMFRRYLRSFEYKGSRSRVFTIGGAVLSLSVGVVLSRLIYPYASAGFTNSLFRLLTFCILCIGYFLIFLSICDAVHFAVRRGEYKKREHTDAEKEKEAALFIKPLQDSHGQYKQMLLISGFVFLCYLPYFLYEYPGIMTADSIVQYQQIIGAMNYSNHHPVVHTLLIKLFYELGMLMTGDVIKSIAFYTVFQMIFMSICHGIVVREIQMTMGYIDIRIVAAATAFFALFPVNAVFAVTLWKDVPFAGISELLSCLLVDIYRRRLKGIRAVDFVLLVFLSTVFSLLRSNAFFAFLAFIPFALYIYRSRLKEIAAALFLSLMLVIIVKGPVFNAFSVERPDFVESLSVPLQQMTRVIAENREIEDKDLLLIDEVIDRTYIKELYAPGFADNIKELVRAGHPEVLEKNRSGYLLLYLKYGLKYPSDYFMAWFDLVGGYIYPDVDYRVGDADGIMSNDLGLYPVPIIGGKFIKIKEILLKLGDFMPLYGMLFSAGAYTWCLIGTFILAAYKRDFILVHVLMILLLMTLLIASPMVDFRYEYAIVLTAPLWLVIGLGTLAK